MFNGFSDAARAHANSLQIGFDGPLKVVRDAIGLRQGAKLKVEVEGGKILLTPVPQVTAEDLYGCVKGFDLTADLEAEHAGEIARGPAADVREAASPGGPKKRGGKR